MIFLRWVGTRLAPIQASGEKQREEFLSKAGFCCRSSLMVAYQNVASVSLRGEDSRAFRGRNEHQKKEPMSRGGESDMVMVTTAPLEGQHTVMTKKTMTRVVLADDHDVVRQGLKRLLDRAPGIEVVGEASNGIQALETVQKLKPDVLLLDIEMPEMDGVEVARRLQTSKHKVHILILSAYDDREYIGALLDIGVDGYLVKGEAPGKIVDAVNGIAQGQKGWVSPQIRKKLEKMNDPALKHQLLSSREIEILRMMGNGSTDSLIGRHFEMNEMECTEALNRLLRKIGAADRKEAVAIARREGWIPNG